MSVHSTFDENAAGGPSVTEASSDLGGVTGLLGDVIAATGELGVGILTLVETVVPPVPSEVLLPLAGFLAQQGVLSLALTLAASVLGSLTGAWVFYGIGRAIGVERAISLVARLPLVDREDLEAAGAWFHRHGPGSVFFGRFVPGVRSLISLPAGADRMPWWTFTLWTAVGSALWNALLIGGGYALGTQWDQVGSVVGRLSDFALLALAVLSLTLLGRRYLRRRQTGGRPAREKPTSVD